MLSTVSLSVRKQLDDKWAAAFNEFGIPFEVASSEAFREAVEDTARLVRMPDHRCALVLTGFGAGKVGARRLHEPKPETDLVAISSTMRTRASKSASKVRCTYSLSWQDRHARI
jgi:DNA-binding transcriptional LysR family regulator